jgi:ATP-dependent Lon protease
MSSEERKYWTTLAESERTSLAEVCKAMDKNGRTADERPLRFRILQSGMPPPVKHIALQRLQQAQRSASPFGGGGESAKIQTWVDKLLSVPFGKYSRIPAKQDAGALLRGMRANMDACVYGLEPVKKWILQAMAQWFSAPSSKGLVLGIQGFPGVGKTRLVRDGIAKSLGRPFYAFNMGGYRDSACLTGHDMTYVGSAPGALAESLIQCGSMDPILYFDEVDKIGSGGHTGQGGEDIAGVLVHLTDETQNHEFQDRYFGAGVPLDFSRALFIFSFNHIEQVDPVLRNRMMVVQIPELTKPEKVEIGTRYLWPSLCEELGLSCQDLVLSHRVAEHVLERHTPSEPGVRCYRARLRILLQAHQMAHLLGDDVPWSTVPWTCEVSHADCILEAFDTPHDDLPPMGMYT